MEVKNTNMMYYSIVYKTVYKSSETAPIASGFIVQDTNQYYLITNFHGIYEDLLSFPVKLHILLTKDYNVEIDFDTSRFISDFKHDIGIYELESTEFNELCSFGINIIKFEHILGNDNSKKFEIELKKLKNFKLSLIDSLNKSLNCKYKCNTLVQRYCFQSV